MGDVAYNTHTGEAVKITRLVSVVHEGRECLRVETGRGEYARHLVDGQHVCFNCRPCHVG